MIVCNVILLKPVYKENSTEPENEPFMINCPLYTGENHMRYSRMGKMRLSFIRSDLLYKSAPLRQV